MLPPSPGRTVHASTCFAASALTPTTIIAQTTTSIDHRPDLGSRNANRSARRRLEPTRAIGDERSASRVKRGISEALSRALDEESRALSFADATAPDRSPTRDE